MWNSIYELFMYLCIDMWSGDESITYDGFKKYVNQLIKNTRSYIGEENHKRLQRMGVEDRTGMTWAEQDAKHEEEIAMYKKLLAYLEDDDNWAW